MSPISRRNILTGTAAAAATALGVSATPARAAAVGGGLIGDGSTCDTGPQPHQPAPHQLEPGQAPPQFVVASWDGAGERGKQLFSRFRQLAQDTGASMTFFLSGLYTLPESKRDLYHPPGHAPGASDIAFLTDDEIRATLRQLRAAWLEGHEIGTHYNGHFCDPKTGVGAWTAEQWHSEIDQALWFVQNWKTTTGFTDLPPLPFDYRKELIGSRTPCLLGRDQLRPVAKSLGWQYDASSPGRQVWPGKRDGLWDLPLQGIPFPGHSFEVLSMDYNMLANQSPDADPNGDPSMRPAWRQQAYEAYMAGFDRAYTTNRAPLFIGNHFEDWNGGIYMDAVEQALRDMAGQPDVHLVSFRQMVQWLEAQDPAVLTKLRTLTVGQTPADWRDYTSGTDTAAKAATNAQLHASSNRHADAGCP